MRTSDTDIIDLLATGKFVRADLYKITLASGPVLHYTRADIDLEYGGDVYYARRALISGVKIKSTRGLEVDEQEITISGTSSADTIYGTPLATAAKNGALDNARVIVRRAFFPDWGHPITGAVHIFEGQVGQVSPRGDQIKIRVRSDLHKLDVSMPQKKYSASCRHVFGDGGCGYDRASTAQSSAATGGSSRSTILCGLSESDGFFDRGVLTVTSGKNQGIKRTIDSYSTGSIGLLGPLPYAPETGMTFSVVRGCAKTIAACTEYDNLSRFGGFPYVPVPETAV